MATLGRVLFYDKNLSKDRTISCGSCHKQEFAFGDNAAVSKGVFDRSGERNSIALMSVSSFSSQYGVDLNGPGGKRFFWDNRAATAADQGRGSMNNPKEMDMSMEEIVAAVQAQPYYAPLFKKAFDDTKINEDNVMQALAEFVNSIGSLNSRFDFAVKANQDKGVFDVINFPFSDFNLQENTGKSLYMLHCGSCHGFDQVNAPLINFTGSPFGSDNASNGLDADPADKGVGAVSGRSEDDGTFKIPSLRNVAKSAPYMHDGRFNTLEEVIEHYNSGVKAHTNLNPLLRNADGSPKQLNLSSADKQALIAFLNTLTDETVLADVRFSDPFKQ
ncbi:MAG: c-type cytochrome [Lewinellaceae bacterium]|nr:c-type cytochrome [Lewinellaceae bacterium]